MLYEWKVNQMDYIDNKTKTLIDSEVVDSPWTVMEFVGRVVKVFSFTGPRFGNGGVIGHHRCCRTAKTRKNDKDRLVQCA
jgi:hypothetical protein